MQWIRLIILLQCNDPLGTQGAGIHAYVTLTRKTALSCISTPQDRSQSRTMFNITHHKLATWLQKRHRSQSNWVSTECASPHNSQDPKDPLPCHWRLASVTWLIDVCLEIMFESWDSVQMYIHIKVSKLNQCESLAIRGASPTQQRLPHAYTKFSSPVSSLISHSCLFPSLTSIPVPHPTPEEMNIHAFSN